MTPLAPPTVTTQETRTLADRLKELSDSAPPHAPAAAEPAIAALTAQVADLSAQIAELKRLVGDLTGEVRSIVEDSALQVVGALLPTQRHQP